MNVSASARPLAQAETNFAMATLADMLFLRAFERRALELSQATPPVVAGSIHLCAGQEAVPYGALAALRPDDQVVATYRGHGWALASGLPAQEVFDEICQRATGLNGGRAGSAFMMAPDRRFMGENSIVGAGVPIACGAAMANQIEGKGRLVIATIGDGAMNQGATHEGLALAAAKRLPLILVVENNGWSELTATRDMFPIERLSQRASGYGIKGATIDGTDPVAVRDSIRIAAEAVRAGSGPVLVECTVPRLWGHYNRDVEHYRPKVDRQEAEARDPIPRLAQRLIAAGALDQAGFVRMQAEAEARSTCIAEAAAAAPLPDPATARHHVVALPAVSAHAPVAAPAETRELTYVGAVTAALRHLLASDERTILFGEDVGKSGGIFGASRDLQKEFGAARVFDMPIAEAAILGSAVGASLSGLKPVAEIMWTDFMLVALDQLINQAANIRYITEGRSAAPMVVRVQGGATPGSCAQHSQCLEALLAHIAGLKVALPATAQDAYDLLLAAAADPDPCIIIEARGLYMTKAAVALHGRAEAAGCARAYAEGTDAAIVTWGTMLPHVLAAAETLRGEGHSVGVLDLRWLAPLDESALLGAARAAGRRVVVAHEANITGGSARRSRHACMRRWLPKARCACAASARPTAASPPRLYCKGPYCPMRGGSRTLSAASSVAERNRSGRNLE